MANWQRLLAKARANPKDLRLEEACKLAEAFGFTHRAGGKHPHVFKRKGYPAQLNFQDAGGGKAKAYQVRQLLDAIDDLGGRPPDD